MSDEPKERKDRVPERLSSIAARARKKFGFDSVLIIATKSESGLTVMYKGGAGNYYAQFGSAKQWLDRESSEPMTDDDE